jgi:hypothetical protein
LLVEGLRKKFKKCYRNDLVQFNEVRLQEQQATHEKELQILEGIEEHAAATTAAVGTSTRQWLIVAGHRPPYCSNTDHDCMVEGSAGEVVRSQLETLFMQQGVDIALVS